MITTTFGADQLSPPQNLTATTIINQQPIAFAGPNRTVRLASGSNSISVITLDTRDDDLDPLNDGNPLSRDADGFIVKYAWEKISGPLVNLSDVNTPRLLVLGATAGTYVFKRRLPMTPGQPM